MRHLDGRKTVVQDTGVLAARGGLAHEGRTASTHNDIADMQVSFWSGNWGF